MDKSGIEKALAFLPFPEGITSIIIEYYADWSYELLFQLCQLDLETELDIHSVMDTSKEEKKQNRGEIDITEHQLTTKQLCTMHSVDIRTGLISSDISERRKMYGMNKMIPNKKIKIPKHEKTSAYKEFKQFMSPPHRPEGSFGIHVLQNGVITRAPPENLVPGDVVFLKAPQDIPADIRIVMGEVKIDMASFTGETDPVVRNSKNLYDNSNPIEATNLLFRYSGLYEGSCAGVVIRTGDNTLMARICSLPTEIGNDKGARTKIKWLQRGIFMNYSLSYSVNPSEFVEVFLVVGPSIAENRKTNGLDEFIEGLQGLGMTIHEHIVSTENLNKEFNDFRMNARTAMWIMIFDDDYDPDYNDFSKWSCLLKMCGFSCIVNPPRVGVEYFSFVDVISWPRSAFRTASDQRQPNPVSEQLQSLHAFLANGKPIAPNPSNCTIS